MVWRLLCALAVVVATAPAAFGQEPQSREEELRREREAKAAHLAPPQSGRFERIVSALEDGRTFERYLNPTEGFFPRIATVTSGSGFSFGGAYRRPRLFGTHVDFNTFASGSVKKYWMVDARLTMPRLARRKAVVELPRSYVE